MSRMSEGLRKVAHSAIDTVEETAITLMNGGLPPEAAVKAAAILTKSAVDKIIHEKYDNQSAANITHNIKSESNRSRLN
jgi:hypothetical protein